MQYTNYGRTGLRVSRFGLGCMRFPADERDAVEMIRYAVDHGVNYLDTAYVYKNSEVITGKALRDGYRDRVHLVTKSPIWNVEKHEDFEKYLDEELERLGTDHIDVYLLHNLYPENWERVRKYDGTRFLDRMVEKGKILHRGFSIHGTTRVFREIVDSYGWEMFQIQLNILDEYNQVGVEGLRYGAGKGLAAVIMEPLRGGQLLNNAPREVLELVEAHPEKRPLVEWCFRWLYDMPEVSVILSGTSSLEQLKENLRIFEHSQPQTMTDADQSLIVKIREAFESKRSIGCTGCRYCMPCPRNVNIPELFKLYNNYQLVKPNSIDKLVYKRVHVEEGSAADRCISCGVCARRCPQELRIPELLKQVHAEMNQ